MSHEVGIWLDHKKAVIVTVSAGQVSTKMLDKLTAPQIVAKVKEYYGIPR